MKKLLVILIMMTVVMGTVFAGPVHINGPGGGDNLLFAFAEPALTETLSYFEAKTIQSRVADTLFAGNFSGFYIYNDLREKPFISVLADSHVKILSPIANYDYGDVTSQEVLSFYRYSKPTDSVITSMATKFL